jgi:hypothetical protein
VSVLWQFISRREACYSSVAVYKLKRNIRLQHWKNIICSLIFMHLSSSEITKSKGHMFLKKPPYFKIRRYIIISIVVWNTEINYNYTWWNFSFVFVRSLTPKNCVLGWLLSKLCVCRGFRSAHLVMLANRDCQISRNQTHYTLLQIVTCLLSFSNSIHKTLSAEPAVARIGKKFFAFYKIWMFITVLKTSRQWTPRMYIFPQLSKFV